jgi:hypothetical protein
LKFYQPPITDLTILKEKDETDRVYTFLAALDSSYEAIRAQIFLSTEKLTFDDVTTLIRQETTRRAAMNRTPKVCTIETKAYAAQHPYFNSQGEMRLRGVPNNTETCDHCKKVEHTRKVCWHLHPHLRPLRLRDEKGDDASRLGWRKGEKEKCFGSLTEIIEMKGGK